MPASVDFALRRQDEPKAFDVVLVTDPQPETEAEVDFIREDLIQALAGVDAKFGLTAGDIMFDDLSLYPRSNAIIGTIGLPWWNIGGNHDLNFEAPDRRYSRETFKRVFGPNYYAFFYAQTLFLMLDDVELSRLRSAQARGGGKYEGRLDEAQLEFVRNVLAHTPDDTLVVVVMHIPIRTFLDDEPYQNLQDREALFSLFEGRRFTVSFAGHTHTTEHHYFDAADGWNGGDAAPSSRADGAVGVVVERPLRSSRRRLGRQPRRHAERLPHPLGRRLELSRPASFRPRSRTDGRCGSRSTAASTAISKDADREFRQVQLLGSPVPRDALGASTLIANVFDGGDKTRVKMVIGDRAAGRDDPPRPARSVRPGGVRPQRGDQETLGQRRQFLPHLDRPPARRSGAGNLSGGGRGGRRIRPAVERAARARGDGVGGRPLSPSARYRSIYCADAGRGPRGARPEQRERDEWIRNRLRSFSSNTRTISPPTAARCMGR